MLTYPLTYRNILRLRRNHWQPLKEGNASLRWLPEEEAFEMRSEQERVLHPYDRASFKALAELNAAWAAFIERSSNG